MQTDIVTDRWDGKKHPADKAAPPRLILVGGSETGHRYYRRLFDGAEARRRPGALRAMELEPRAGATAETAGAGAPEPDTVLRYAWAYLVESFAQSSLWFFATELAVTDPSPRHRLHLSRLVEIATAGMVGPWRRLQRELDARYTIAVLRGLDLATLRDIGIETPEHIVPTVRARQRRAGEPSSAVPEGKTPG
ncbi:hypothetical protein GCM10028812_03060 [Ancylobacter sonchi]